ncbi:MAG: thioredoxin-disulfide reductase [Candidatus Geothermarchaeota archaeon]
MSDISTFVPKEGFLIKLKEAKADERKLYDVIVIGSGPAGLTASIYCAMNGLSTLVIAGYEWGGQPMKAHIIENYPGFPYGIKGPELMMNMRKQAAKFGVEFVEEDATEVNFKIRPFEVYVRGKTFRSKTVILALGAKHKELGLKAEKEFLGRGLSYCAICDGHFFKDKVVAVVGGGDSALSDALYLANLATKVYLIHRREEFRAKKYLQDLVRSNQKIEIMFNTAIIDIIGKESVEGIKIRNLKTNEESYIKVDGIFVAIGYEPSTELVKGHLELTPNGYIKTYEFTKTSVPGVFAAGDVMDDRYRQIVTAAAFGAMAAMDAIEYLRSQAGESPSPL